MAAAGLAVLLLGCGTAGSKSSELTSCEQAWEQGLGNAQAPGVVQDDWIAECRSEGGDDMDLIALDEATGNDPEAEVAETESGGSDTVDGEIPADHCETARRTLETAFEAHWVTYGNGPTSQKELLDRGFILSVDPDFVISSDGNNVVAAPGSRCP